MDKRWKMQAIAACTILMLMFGAAAARAVAVMLPDKPEETVQRVQLPNGLPWATVAQTAPVFTGAGLHHSMAGMIRAGEAVEVLGQQDGWTRVWHYSFLPDAVWVSSEYLKGE